MTATTSTHRGTMGRLPISNVEIALDFNPMSSSLKLRRDQVIPFKINNARRETWLEPGPGRRVPGIRHVGRPTIQDMSHGLVAFRERKKKIWSKSRVR